MHPHFALLAQYNQWMNRKLYAAADVLPAAALAQPRGAFFGSILGTVSYTHLDVYKRQTLTRKAAAIRNACG